MKTKLILIITIVLTVSVLIGGCGKNVNKTERNNPNEITTTSGSESKPAETNSDVTVFDGGKYYSVNLKICAFTSNEGLPLAFMLDRYSFQDGVFTGYFEVKNTNNEFGTTSYTTEISIPSVTTVDGQKLSLTPLFNDDSVDAYDFAQGPKGMYFPPKASRFLKVQASGLRSAPQSLEIGFRDSDGEYQDKTVIIPQVKPVNLAPITFPAALETSIQLADVIIGLNNNPYKNIKSNDNCFGNIEKCEINTINIGPDNIKTTMSILPSKDLTLQDIYKLKFFLVTDKSEVIPLRIEEYQGEVIARRNNIFTLSSFGSTIINKPSSAKLVIDMNVDNGDYGLSGWPNISRESESFSLN